MPKVTDEHKELVRAQLVDAAIEIMVSHGPEQATTRRILDRAQLSPGALYTYFATKDELFAAVANRFMELDRDWTDRANGTPVEGMDAEMLADVLVHGLHGLFGSAKSSILFQLRSASISSDAVRSSLEVYDRAVVERNGRLNRAAVSVGLFRQQVDPDALVEMVEMFFTAFSAREQTGSYATSRRAVLEEFFSALADRALDPDHPLFETTRTRLLEIAR